MNDFIREIYIRCVKQEFRVKSLYVRRWRNNSVVVITPPMDLFDGDIRLDKYFKEQDEQNKRPKK